MPDDRVPSLKPPKEWWDKTYKEVKEKNPDYTEEQVRQTIGAIWYKNLSEKQKKKLREKEGKKYGVAKKSMNFDQYERIYSRLLKSFYHRTYKDIEQPLVDDCTKQSLIFTYYGDNEEHAQPTNVPILKGVRGITKVQYKAQPIDNFKYRPAVIVNCYDKSGQFMNQEIHTAPEILGNKEKYDKTTFWILIHNLSETLGMDKEEEKLDFISECVDELKSRIKAEKEILNEAKDEIKASTATSNWELEDRYFFGKSFIYTIDLDV